MAYFVAHLVFSIPRKKQNLVSKSNKETPKEITEEGLTSLRGTADYSLEFRYCFLVRFSAFSQKVTLFSDPAPESGGPSLPF